MGKRQRLPLKYGETSLKWRSTLDGILDIQLKLEITPLDFSVSYQNHGTYGEQIQVKVQGAQVVGVDDRCGLLKSFDLTEDGLLVTIGDRLLSLMKNSAGRA